LGHEIVGLDMLSGPYTTCVGSVTDRASVSSQTASHHAQHGGTKAVFEMTYAGRLAMFAIRVSYPGGHSVWLTRRFPTVAWGLKKDALPFPTEADAARTIARLRPSGPVSIEPIAPEIARSA
jgi:hypothetical protein